jgi:hypothetical protein
MKKFLAILLLALVPVPSMAADPALMHPAQAISATGTSVDASAYLQLDAATDVTAAAFLVNNGTDVPVKLAIGGSGSEVDIPQYVGNGLSSVINYPVAKATRLAIRAIGADAASGYVTVTLLQ